jgi:hypothetical protein
MSLVSFARAAGVTALPSSRHEHDIDNALSHDLTNMLAVFGQRAHVYLARVRLGRTSRGADAQRHIRVLGIGQDKGL